MRRRQFLRVTLQISVGGALALGGATLAHRLIWDYAPGPRAESPEPRFLSGREYAIVRAAALRILDGAAPDPQLDEAAPQCRFIDGYLSQLDPALSGDVRALLSLLELYPLLTGGFSRFSRLPAAAQDAVLASWESSRTALLRQGMQALKAMCFLAHYQDERSFASLGYSGPIVPAQGLGRVLPAP